MPRIGFEAPPSVRELIDLLNRSGQWELTLIDSSGKVYGHYQTELFRTQVPTAPGEVIVYSGEADDPNAGPLFSSQSDEEAFCFLYGCFRGTFGGRSLEAIQDEITRRAFERDRPAYRA